MDMNQAIPAHIGEALMQILDYFRIGVYRNYINLDPEDREGHIFSAFFTVALWLHMPRDGKFPLGSVFITRGALTALSASADSPAKFLRRHAEGDWGEVDEEDRAENDRSMR